MGDSPLCPPCTELWKGSLGVTDAPASAPPDFEQETHTIRQALVASTWQAGRHLGADCSGITQARQRLPQKQTKRRAAPRLTNTKGQSPLGRGDPGPALQNSPPWDPQELLVLLMQLSDTLGLVSREQASAALGRHDLDV